MANRLLDSDPRREQRRQSILLARLSARHRAGVRRVLNNASADMLQHWIATQEVPSLPATRRAIEGAYKLMAVTSFQVFGARIFEQGKASGKALERKEDFADFMERIALDYVASEVMRERITDATDTTRQDIVDIIANGFAEGLGVPEIARDVARTVPGLTRLRAERIARTETHSAANSGAVQAARRTGLRLRKEWAAEDGPRTRPTHREADGQIVGMDEPFLVGDSRLMFPGDPNGSAEEVIHCRCATAFITED